MRIRCEFCGVRFEASEKNVIEYRFEAPKNGEKDGVNSSVIVVAECPKCRLETEIRAKGLDKLKKV